jgi:2,4-dienoyl-CoA reductase-like NADH-dependent reductase (Old Yellow Enzyme family)/thioredoxin reductase
MLSSSVSSSMFPKLFEPGRIGALWLKNRLIKAPTVTGFATRDGCVTDRMATFYREMARGGVGLVIVENSHVDAKASKSIACQLSSSHDEHKSGLKWLATAIRSNGARACLQLGHGGRQKMIPLLPIKAPSRVPSEDRKRAGLPLPEELTLDEIAEIIEAFGSAAERARHAGFDMVEILGCHGYLITNFLSPLANRRSDRYGGNIENRMRFLLEVIDSVVRKTGSDYPLSVRLNGSDYEQGSITFEETKAVAVALEKGGVSALHITGGTFDAGHMEIVPMYVPAAPHLWAAEEIKKVVTIPVILSGSVTTPRLAERIREQGKADFISLARALLADPFFPLKAQEGRPEDIRPCIRCVDGCTTKGVANGFISCSVNAALGGEGPCEGSPAAEMKKIAVIGGGPAGMEAARVASGRGHHVTLFEKRKLGGTLIEASVPEFKADLRGFIDYLSTQIRKAGVRVVNTEATARTIQEGQFDAVIVATGAVPADTRVPGIDRPRVVEALSVLRGSKTGRDIVVVGGGRIGCDVALFLAEQGKKVTITTRGEDIAQGMNPPERRAYFERVSKQEMEIRTGVHLEEITEHGVRVADQAGARSEIKADHVVLAAGLKPDRRLFDELAGTPHMRVYAVGDCVEPRMIFEAVHEAHWVACNLL